MISENTILEFRKAILEEYEKDLDINETKEILHELVNYFNLLEKIYHQMKIENENNLSK